MQGRLRDQSAKEMVTDLALLHALDVRPPHDYLAHWAAASKDRLVLLSAEHLASCLSCFASGGYTPQPDWLAAFTSALDGQVTTLGPVQLLRCTVILDRMGARLPGPLLDHLYTTTGPGLVDVDPAVLAQLLWTLQSAAIPPPQPWLMDLIDAAQVQVGRVEVGALALHVWPHMAARCSLLHHCLSETLTHVLYVVISLP
jgi:hypothetical protein